VITWTSDVIACAGRFVFTTVMAPVPAMVVPDNRQSSRSLASNPEWHSG